MICLTEEFWPQPTISLYLGGTGLKCGDYFRLMRAQLPLRERKMIEPFFIDSHKPWIQDHHRTRHYCYEDLNSFFSPVYREFKKHRMPENLGLSPIVSSCDGCGVTRIFGAASLVACRDDFLGLIRNAVGRLKRQGRGGAERQQVFITASSCGGTGAGMIIDVAAMVRHFYEQEVGQIPRILLFLLGPAALLEDPNIPILEQEQERMKASTYALLKELNHFAEGNPFISGYRLRDQRIEISNASDDDRLFDWVFYLDGKSTAGASATTQEELAWIVAESQLHLCTTEIGRKFTEILPNQREGRARSYAADYVHSSLQGHLSDRLRQQLALSSRRTFLASLSVRTARFPAPEIASLLRAEWVCEALRKLLKRSHDDAWAEEYDNLLGMSENASPDPGLLSNVGLDERSIRLFLEEHHKQWHGLPVQPFSPQASPESLLKGSRSLIDKATELLSQMEKGWTIEASSVGEGDGEETASALRQAMENWLQIWEEGFTSSTGIAFVLWKLAWDPLSGRGIQWLDGLVVRLISELTDRSTSRQSWLDLSSIREQVSRVRRNRNALSQDCERARSKMVFRLKSLVSKLTNSVRSDQAYDKGTMDNARYFVEQLNSCRRSLIEFANRAFAAALAQNVYKHAARRLRMWRDQKVLPALTITETALEVAEARWRQSEAALRRYSGKAKAGEEWRSYSTISLYDRQLMIACRKRIEDRYSIEDAILEPLSGEGLYYRRDRLSLNTLAETTPQKVVAILAHHVREQTRGLLSFLDLGWQLEEARPLMTKAAGILDAGAQPLTNYDRDGLATTVQGCFLKPRGLELPDLFGRKIAHFNQLHSGDPLKMGVVSYAFGIPPNGLVQMDEFFAQYVLHLGDPLRNQAHDRYPLHVFRNGVESFNEPHSPLALARDRDNLQGWINLARALGIVQEESKVQLVIRSIDLTPDQLAGDWNSAIELAEEILQHLARHPDRALPLLDYHRLVGLRNLYIQRHGGAWHSAPEKISVSA